MLSVVFFIGMLSVVMPKVVAPFDFTGHRNKTKFSFFPSSSIQGNLGIVMGAALASAK
jgi:hypothetical protein